MGRRRLGPPASGAISPRETHHAEAALLPDPVSWPCFRRRSPAARPPRRPRARPATAAAPRGICAPVSLFSDDFSRYPPGWLSKPVGTLNAAIQEYHYLPHRGVPTQPWANAICHLDPWVAGDEDGVPYLEQHSIADLPDFTVPMFVTGDHEWADYTVEAKMKPLSPLHFAGLAFRYQTNKYHYLFALAGGKEARLVVRRPLDKAYREGEWRTIATKPFAYELNKKYYTLKVENQGPRIRAYVDGKLVIEASDEEIKGGKIGLAASSPARYQAVKVTACTPAKNAIDARIKQREDELARLRADNPQPKLWKRFATPKFGAGRNVRFGDLDGDGQLDMLIAQNIPRVRGDAFDHISALTAVTLDGRVLWQTGRPDPRNGLLTNDTPFQIHDIDGDKRNEVILIRDFKIQVLDGRTGKVEKWVWMPPAPTPAAAAAPAAGAPVVPNRPYELYSGDSIIFANLTGKPGRRDFILKDRYRHVWAFSRDLKLLWQGDEDTGHFPYPVRRRRRRQGRAVHRPRHVGPQGQAAVEPRRQAEGPRRRGRGRQLRRRPQGPAPGLLGHQRRGLHHAGPEGQHPEAHHRRPHPDRGGGQVPPRPARPAIRHHQLLAQPGHRHACSTPTATC